MLINQCLLQLLAYTYISPYTCTSLNLNYSMEVMWTLLHNLIKLSNFLTTYFCAVSTLKQKTSKIVFKITPRYLKKFLKLLKMF